MKMQSPLLEVRNLHVHFSSGWGKRRKITKAVDGISFEIYEGETFGLVGESGCGKTTTGRAIIRLYDVTEGEVYFNGKVISGPMNKELHKEITSNIAMVFQDPIASLNPRMTVQEIIGEGLKIQNAGDNKEIPERVVELLELVGLNREHATRYPHEFSGGQRQRIGIARALAVNPRLIIADEPVSALDVSVQAQVINLLNRLQKELGLTILFIAHDLSLVKYFSDRIGVMYYGKLVELAPADKLYKHPLHPYTQSLISAIPQPDPVLEKRRKRIIYDPTKHNYNSEKPEMREVEPGHFVYCSKSELADYKRRLRS